MTRRLNAKEEQVMTILWKLKKAFVQDIIAEIPDPQPHYNTISSIIRKLESEGFISHVSNGRSHQYFPIASKKAFRSAQFDHLFSQYFSNSKKKFLKYSIEKLDINKNDLRNLIKK